MSRTRLNPLDAALREAGVRAPVLRIAKAPARKRKP